MQVEVCVGWRSPAGEPGWSVQVCSGLVNVTRRAKNWWGRDCLAPGLLGECVCTAALAAGLRRAELRDQL